MATISSVAGAAGNFTAGGSWVGGVAPTAADDAVLQATTTSMTIDTGAVCRSLTTTAFTGTLTHTAGVTLTIGDATAGSGNVALVFGTFTYTLGDPATSAIAFISTSATVQTINFNGKTTGNITFNASSNGSWQLIGSHLTGATATVTLTQGTLDTNGQTCSWGIFSSSNSNVRSLTLGASAITLLGASTTVWNISTVTNLTLSAASSTITCSGTSATFTGGSNKTYGTVVLSGAGTCVVNTSTFGTLTRTGTAIKTDIFSFGGDVTVTTALNVNGNSSINRVMVQSTVAGTTRTITSASNSISNADFMDITGAGAGSWNLAAITGLSGDSGGNNGITFTTPATQTFSGTVNDSWSTNAWTSRVPLPQDDVVISSAFSATQTVTADMPRLGRSIDWTGSTGTPTWNFSTGGTMYGSLTLISGMNNVTGSGLTFSGRSSFSITSATRTFAGGITITAPAGTYTLNDVLVTSGNFTLNNGTFVTGNFACTSLTFVASNNATRAFTGGTTNWNLTQTSVSTIVNIANTGTLTFSGASMTFTISTTSASTRTFAGAGLTFGTLTYTVAGSTGELDITGANTFNIFNFSDSTNARTLKFTAATTTTILSQWNVFGLSGKVITIASITAATHTLSSAAGAINSDWLNLTNSIATGGAGWYAGANSTDNGGNTGWIFTAAPGGGGGSSSLAALYNMLLLK